MRILVLLAYIVVYVFAFFGLLGADGRTWIVLINMLSIVVATLGIQVNLRLLGETQKHDKHS